jgi:hypothetical protein
MNTRMAANGYKIDTLVEAIATSPQFLNKRWPDARLQSSMNGNNAVAATSKKGE